MKSTNGRPVRDRPSALTRGPGSAACGRERGGARVVRHRGPDPAAQRLVLRGEGLGPPLVLRPRACRIAASRGPSRRRSAPALGPRACPRPPPSTRSTSGCGASGMVGLTIMSCGSVRAPAASPAAGAERPDDGHRAPPLQLRHRPRRPGPAAVVRHHQLDGPPLRRSASRTASSIPSSTQSPYWTRTRPRPGQQRTDHRAQPARQRVRRQLRQRRAPAPPPSRPPGGPRTAPPTPEPPRNAHPERRAGRQPQAPSAAPSSRDRSGGSALSRSASAAHPDHRVIGLGAVAPGAPPLGFRRRDPPVAPRGRSTGTSSAPRQRTLRSGLAHRATQRHRQERRPMVFVRSIKPPSSVAVLATGSGNYGNYPDRDRDVRPAPTPPRIPRPAPPGSQGPQKEGGGQRPTSLLRPATKPYFSSASSASSASPPPRLRPPQGLASGGLRLDSAFGLGLRLDPPRPRLRLDRRPRPPAPRPSPRPPASASRLGLGLRRPLSLASRPPARRSASASPRAPQPRLGSSLVVLVGGGAGRRPPPAGRSP
jgi:hypothetical protein